MQQQQQQQIIPLDDINQLIKYYAFNIQIRIQQFIKWGKSNKFYINSTFSQQEDISTQAISKLQQKYSGVLISHPQNIRIVRKFSQRIIEITQYFINQKCQKYSTQINANVSFNNNNKFMNIKYILKLLQTKIKQKINTFVGKIQCTEKEENQEKQEKQEEKVKVGEIIKFAIELVNKGMFLKILKCQSNNKVKTDHIHRKRSYIRACATSIKVNQYNQNEQSCNQNEIILSKPNNKRSIMSIQSVQQTTKLKSTKFMKQNSINSLKKLQQPHQYQKSLSTEQLKKSFYKRRPLSTKNIPAISSTLKNDNRNSNSRAYSRKKYSLCSYYQNNNCNNESKQDQQNPSKLAKNNSFHVNISQIKWNDLSIVDSLGIKIDKLYVNMNIDKRHIQKVVEKLTNTRNSQNNKQLLFKQMMRRNQKIHDTMKKTNKKLSTNSNISSTHQPLSSLEPNQLSLKQKSIDKLQYCKNLNLNHSNIYLSKQTNSKRYDKKIFLQSNQDNENNSNNLSQAYTIKSKLKTLLNQPNNGQQYMKMGNYNKKSLRNVINQNFYEKKKYQNRQNQQRNMALIKKRKIVLVHQHQLNDKENFQEFLENR